MLFHFLFQVSEYKIAKRTSKVKISSPMSELSIRTLFELLEFQSSLIQKISYCRNEVSKLALGYFSTKLYSNKNFKSSVQHLSELSYLGGFIVQFNQSFSLSKQKNDSFPFLWGRIWTLIMRQLFGLLSEVVNKCWSRRNRRREVFISLTEKKRNTTPLWCCAIQLTCW